MKRLILTIAALALGAGLAHAGSHTVIRMGTEGAYPPWNFLNDAGEVDGCKILEHLTDNLAALDHGSDDT